VPRTGNARTRLERHIYRGSGPATARNGLSPTAAADARYARSAVSPQIDPQCRHIASASRSRIAIELVFSVQTKVGVSESPPWIMIWGCYRALPVAGLAFVGIARACAETINNTYLQSGAGGPSRPGFRVDKAGLCAHKGADRVRQRSRPHCLMESR
jgi:hypothetical protein